MISKHFWEHFTPFLWLRYYVRQFRRFYSQWFSGEDRTEKTEGTKREKKYALQWKTFGVHPRPIWMNLRHKYPETERDSFRIIGYVDDEGVEHIGKRLEEDPRMPL